jgi:hypothetical protein
MLRPLPIPDELTALIESGFWPRNNAEACRQNLHPLLLELLIHRFAPEEDKIFFTDIP